MCKRNSRLLTSFERLVKSLLLVEFIVHSVCATELECVLSAGYTADRRSKKKSGSEAAQFDQKTIQEFKEAFGIMDQNKDGIVDKQDLKDLYAMMGQIASDAQIDAMIKEAPGPINFTVFLTLFGEKLTDCGKISEDELLKILQNKRGEPFDDEEIKAMYKGKPPIENGQVDYKAFAHLITTGAAEELAKA
ncbi:Myosin regulatory light chain 1 [Dirofilaria immitis]|nr:Myosin regulatory light chain 1 [Dirofilaria immitis]